MNERIKELVFDAGLIAKKNNGAEWRWGYIDPELEKKIDKFAELIVSECATTIENRAPGQMGKAGEGWTNGYDEGLKTAAFLIKKHFGVDAAAEQSKPNRDLMKGLWTA